MGCAILIIKSQKICDCCKKPVAEKNCFWRNIDGYVTIRKTDLVSAIDFEDGLPYVYDVKSNLHYCKQCWSSIIKKILTK